MIFEVKSSFFARHRQSYVSDNLLSLSANEVGTIVKDLGIKFRERIFTPFVTLNAFLSQVLEDDSSCRKALIVVNAILHLRRKKLQNINSGSFCKAKMRLPVELIRQLTFRLCAFSTEIPVWPHGAVKVVDGTKASMADTPSNRAQFPFHTDATSGFPMARILALFCLATGSLIDLAIAPMSGKGTGELSLLRQLWGLLEEGDTLLGDCLFSCFAVLVGAQTRGCYVVAEFRQSSSWRLRRKLNDQIIRIAKPPTKPVYISAEEFSSWPAYVDVRIVKLQCGPKGHRIKTKYILTTHLDSNQVKPQEILDLYKQRWQVELNFRSIKTVLGMDMIKAKTPAMVIKEIWIHMLAYNLIRAHMVKASNFKKVAPSTLSFRATQQIVLLCRLVTTCSPKCAATFRKELDDLIASQTVGNRPDRFEPRAIKRRRKNYASLHKDRKSAKTKLHKKSKGKRKP